MFSYQLTPLISVRLENDRTKIYVDNKEFKQCKYLLLTVDSTEKWKKQETFTSIDDVATYLDNSMEVGHSNNKDVAIPPKAEFWGHCSNLQAWVENNYDLRLIHTNLGIPLLKKLCAKGDSKAIISFKEYLAELIEVGGLRVYSSYKSEINTYFTLEEKEVIIQEGLYDLEKYTTMELPYLVQEIKMIKNFKIPDNVMKNLREIIIERIKHDCRVDIEENLKEPKDLTREYHTIIEGLLLDQKVVNNLLEVHFKSYFLHFLNSVPIQTLYIYQHTACKNCANRHSLTGEECTYCRGFSNFKLHSFSVINISIGDFTIKDLGFEEIYFLFKKLKTDGWIS